MGSAHFPELNQSDEIWMLVYWQRRPLSQGRAEYGDDVLFGHSDRHLSYCIRSHSRGHLRAVSAAGNHHEHSMKAIGPLLQRMMHPAVAWSNDMWLLVGLRNGELCRETE
jgi:hypothetical protein